MKNILILFAVLMLPIFGFGQVDLVRWNGATNGFSPVVLNLNISSLNMLNQGGVTMNNNGQYNQWFTTGNWPNPQQNSGGKDISKYIQYTITVNANYQIVLNEFKFKIRTQGGTANYQVLYSKDPTFSTGVYTLIPNTSINSTFVDSPTNNFSNVNPVTSTGGGSTVYIRLYAYNTYNAVQIQHSWGGNTGATITGTVSDAVPPKPIATDDTVSITHNTTTPISVLNNDTFNGLATTINIIQSPANGTLNINGSNQVVYAPSSNYTGTDTFKYTLTNANGTSESAATVTVKVAPKANDDMVTANQNTPTTISVLTNDLYAGANPTVTITQAPGNGSANVNASGQIIYTSAGSFTGQTTIKYKITSEQGTSNVATVAITVVPPIAIAVNDMATTLKNEAVTINVLNNDNTYGLTTTINYSQVTNGTVAINGSQLIFTPTTGFTGTGSFKYTLTNINGTSTPATVTISVTAPIPPTAISDSFPVALNVYTDLAVLANDNLGSAITITTINTTNPSHGTVSVNANNTIRYTPTMGYVGSDSFTYRIQTIYGISSYVSVNIVLAQTPTGPLCGEYYIGTNGHFTTLTQAVDYLNANGVSCAVTFLLTNALYENVTNNTNGEKFPLTINAINTTAVNTVTFKPALNKNVIVKVNNIIVSNNLIHPLYLFKLNGADNIIFEGKNGNSSFTAINNDYIINGNERTVFWLTNATDNIAFQNLIIQQGNQSADYAFAGGIFQGGENQVKTAGSSTSSNLLISNNKFSGLKQGIYIDNPNSNCTITDNEFGNETNGKMQGAIYLKQATNFTISKNVIRDVKTDFSAQKYMAVYVDGKKGTISKNILYNIRRTAGSQSISGIRLKSTAANNANAITISNNFITDLQTPGGGGDDQGAFGIRLEADSKFVKIYHNSINLKQDYQQDGFSAALFLEENVQKIDVRNNIFNNKLSYNNAGRACIIIKTPGELFSFLDYNNYFSTGGVIGINGGLTNNSYSNPSYLQSLSAWKSALGKDAHSTNVAPVFVNENNDLHLVPGSITNIQALGGVSGLPILDDIDDDERYENRPTMGADEIAETRCSSTVTWNGSSWSNGQPASWEGDEDVKIVIAGAYNFTSNNLLKSCQLEVAEGVTLTIKENATYVVEDQLTLNKQSKLIVENNGSFVQVSDKSENSIFKIGDPFQDAIFTVKRYTQPVRRYDYTYWSSPVNEADWSLHDLSPNTLLDKYMSYNPASGWVVHLNGNEQMETGRGYIVRAPQNFPINSELVDDQTHFEGTPNNGPITFEAGGPGTFNLLGNPYASAISADVFIDENYESIIGTLYFWTHNTPVTNYVYTPGDYAVYNGTGGVASQPAESGGEKPSGNIASGQAFFVERKTNANNTINYSNKMRVIGVNNQFFKTTPTEMDQTVYKNRFWINVSNVNHAYSELLVGYVTGATDGFDDAYDGKTFGGTVISMYSLLNDTPLAIQGKSLPFEVTDVIPLGYTTTTAGEYSINMNQFDGVFENQNVYLKDKVNNTLTNLKELNYTFTTQSGTFNNRFEIVFQSPEDTLGTETPVLDAHDILVFKNGNQINVKSNELTLDQIIVYDLVGRVIFTQNDINSQEFAIPSLATNNQVVVVKVITDTQAELIKKVILN